jgi:integrase
MPAKPSLKLVAPSGVKWKVPGRRPNRDLRTKEYLTPDEVEKLIEASKSNRYPHRDATIILTAYRHGLRVSELIDLRWDQIDWPKANLHVRRLKGGIDSVHSIRGDELRALRRLQREQEPKSPFVFTSERGGPLTRFAVAKMIEKAGKDAGLGDSVHFHQLRHACGFKLANDGHDTRALQSWLGHSDIKHTAKYSELTPRAFRDFWR